MTSFCDPFLPPLRCHMGLKNVHSSVVVVHERECYNYVCSVWCWPMSVYTYLRVYVCSCMCMCSPRGAYLCHCQYVGAGVSCVLVCRRHWMLSIPAGDRNGPCPVQKTARTSHLQAKGPYPEDISLPLGQQRHDQQGDEAGYRHAHRAWLSIRTGSTRCF